MRKQHLLFILLALLTTVYSCKKDDKDDATTTNGTANNDTQNYNDYVTGDLTATYVFIDTTYPNTSSIKSYQTVEASFIKTVKENALTLADTVYINGYPTKRLTAKYHSLTTTNLSRLNILDSCIWTVVDTTSHNAIPNFTYSFTAPMPTVLGKLPDTVTKLEGFKLDLQIAGADSVVMAISGDTTNSDGYISKSFNPANNNYYFSSDDIAKIRLSSIHSLRQSFVIVAYTSTIQNFDGKYMRFTKTYTYYGGIWVNKE